MKHLFVLAFFLLASTKVFPIEQNCIPGSAAQGCTSGGSTGGGTTTSCTVTTICSNGSVSCTSVKNACKRGLTWVECDLVKTYC